MALENNHTSIQPSVLASRALAVLYNNAVLLGLVYRDYDTEFTAQQGDTVMVRTPATFTPGTFSRASGITLQDGTESKIDVKLDTIADTSIAITAEALTLDVTSFDEQFLNPIMEGFAQYIDGLLAEKLIDIAEGSGGGGTLSMVGGKPSSIYLNARAQLTRAKLPFSERYAVMSPEANATILTEALLVEADTSGSTQGLREANAGRLFGIDSYESQVFGYGSGDKGQADGCIFHRSALAFVSRPLARPIGVASDQYAVQSYKGLSLRVVRDYDITKKQDILSFDLLYGLTAVRKEAVIQANFGLGS